MSNSAQVIIGSGFGDEGKGLITDYYANQKQKDALVVRFNGGAQAGHTVVTPDNKRHIFHHFGSGSFANTKSYLSEFFLVNPLIFLAEREELTALGVPNSILRVYVHPEAVITTPYDMMINQILETVRGGTRHGSCGLGINETVERSLNVEFTLKTRELLGSTKKVTKNLTDKLNYIHEEWVPKRLAKLNIDIDKETHVSEDLKSAVKNKAIIKKWIEDTLEFSQRIDVVENEPILRALRNDALIFEGAQGLLLDQHTGYEFPYLTRSNTGVWNVLKIAKENNIEHLNLTYVTRAYVTRHGRGPMPHEMDFVPTKFKDTTNVPNSFQETLRFGELDIDFLAKTINTDTRDFEEEEFRHINYTKNMAVTHIDQLSDSVPFFMNGSRWNKYKKFFVEAIQEKRESATMLLSKGPTRNDVFPYEKSEK